MTYLKHTRDGDVVITPVAMILSGLDRAEMLELCTLDKAVVLFDSEMSHGGRVELAAQLTRMADSLIADMIAEAGEVGKEDENGKTPFEEFGIPKIALEAANLVNKNLHLFTDNGIVVIVNDAHDFTLSPKTKDRLDRHGVTPEQFNRMLNEVDDEDD